MRKVYNFLVITITLALVFMLGCIGWLEYFGFNLNVLLATIMAGLYGLFMGVTAISLEVGRVIVNKDPPIGEVSRYVRSP